MTTEQGKKYIEYATQLGVKTEGMNWVNSTLKAYLRENPQSSQTEIEHILDFLASEESPKKMIRMSYEQAKKLSQEWSDAQQKKGAHLQDDDTDIKSVYEFNDGTKIVELLSKKALQREGFLMRHCSGSLNPSDYRIYSYRDKENRPHATFQVAKYKNEFLQIKGKGNGPISPRYIKAIVDFLAYLGFPIREQEMANLGYYAVDKYLMEMIVKFIPIPKGISLGGQFYVYGNQT